MSVNLVLQATQLSCIERIPAAERLPPHVTPEGASAEGLAATTQLVPGEPAFPQMDELSGRTHAFDLPEEAFQERRAAPFRAGDEEDTRSALSARELERGHRTGERIPGSFPSTSFGSTRNDDGSRTAASSKRSRSREDSAIFTAPSAASRREKCT